MMSESKKIIDQKPEVVVKTIYIKRSIKEIDNVLSNHLEYNDLDIHESKNGQSNGSSIYLHKKEDLNIS